MRTKPTSPPDPAPPVDVPPDPVDVASTPEPAVTAEPVPGILTALLAFTLPQTAQQHGASAGGRNPRHDLVCAADHLIEASNRLKSIALDATAAKEFVAAAFLNSLIARIS
jgi:hypothetical protein